ncbi:hypothetical protein [Lysobacter gummosus]|uniref:hypothetical protein n=1 Tax=Lysobacter gummosus TaxID=262324 RepID=UPI00363C0BFE
MRIRDRSSLAPQRPRPHSCRKADCPCRRTKLRYPPHCLNLPFTRTCALSAKPRPPRSPTIDLRAVTAEYDDDRYRFAPSRRA